MVSALDRAKRSLVALILLLLLLLPLPLPLLLLLLLLLLALALALSLALPPPVLCRRGVWSQGCTENGSRSGVKTVLSERSS
jgi:uncharacterized membrane protein